MRQPKLMDASGGNWFDLSWPSLTIFAFFLGLMVASQVGSSSFEEAFEKVRNSFTQGRSHGNAVPNLVLVITANRAQQLQAVATLSPRGLEPLLAKNLQEVNRQLAAHPKVVKLAVVDAELRDAAAIERALRTVLPERRIVVIERNKNRETIGPMLLDRL
jgi:hypothetical protein